MQKGEKYLEGIIAAQSREQAVAVLSEMAKDLGIGQSYGKLAHISERLDLYKESFQNLRKQLTEEAVPSIQFLQELRLSAIYCYQELTDELAGDINRLKIAFGDDRRSEVRSSVIKRLWKDENFKKANKANSISALEKIYSDDPEYKEWLACSSLSYGLWNDLRDTLKYINMFIDAIASQIRTEQTVQRMDMK